MVRKLENVLHPRRGSPGGSKIKMLTRLKEALDPEGETWPGGWETKIQSRITFARKRSS